MNKKLLKDYAKLIIKMGVNLQKNQMLVITANVDDNYFVEILTKEAYKAHAKYVRIEWISDEVNYLNYKYGDINTLKDLPVWQEEKLKYDVENLPARIVIDSSNPDALYGIPSNKINEVSKSRLPIIMKYREMMDNKHQWCIAGIPGKKWAKKVYPELSLKKAIDKLWDDILYVSRVYGDPISNWNNHNKNLKTRIAKLNSFKIKKLIYKSNESKTDFEIEIPKELIFEAGSEKTLNGIEYNPNMPTEECFTSPDKYSANGVVYATKPLSIRGNVVSNFGFRFKDGKIIEVISENEYEKKILEDLINTDPNACYLGEVALVPFSSPINQRNILFYSTLYDENACCHLAIGRAFVECINNYQNLSDDEINKININKSSIHVDFMIGTSDLSIDAITYNGDKISIFKNGEFVI